MSALIQLTLDGSLVRGDGHQVTMRDLARSMSSLQAATDRAYLDVKLKHVWKHARLPLKFYEEADFIVGDPEQGSFIIKFISDKGGLIVKRLKEALSEPYASAIAGGDQQIYSINHQVEARKGQIENKIIVPQSFDQFLKQPDKLAVRAFGDKSINKNIDQMLTPVRKDEGALLKIALKPGYHEKAETFSFNKEVAKNFKTVIGKRMLGNPVVYRGKMRALDRGHNQKTNFKGKFINVATDRDMNIYIQSEADYTELVPYLTKDEITIVACPVIEYDSYDPMGGDIQFVKILK